MGNSECGMEEPHPAFERRGFTLLELVVVLAIVALSVALVLPALETGLRHWRLQGAVQEVATLVRFTRNQAVARRKSLQVILDASRRVYWLDDAEAPVLDNPEQAGEKGIRLYALPTDLRFGSLAGEPGPVRGRVGIVFFPKGNSTGGEIQVVDPRGKEYRLHVEPLTGRARIVEPRAASREPR